MTREEFYEKYNELLEKATINCLELAEKALSSMAIELNDYDNDYLLPKTVLTAALEEEVETWRPFSSITVKNIRLFL